MIMEITTREQLLDGLYYVHQMLGKMQQVMSEYIRLERAFTAKLKYAGLKQHTEEIKTDTIKDKSMLLMITVSITIAVFYFLLSFLLGADGSSAILYLIPAAIAIFAKKKPKLKIAAIIFQVLMILWFIQILIKSAPPVMAVVILVILVGVVVGEVFFIKNYNSRYVTSKNRAADKHNQAVIAATDARNAEIEQYNKVVAAKRTELYDQYAQLRDELLGNTSHWFPADYYNMVAVEHFIDSVRNFKASTVKEMVNLFDTSQYRAEVLAYQREQSQKMDVIIQQNEDIKLNQEEQKKLMRASNMLKVMDMGQKAYYAKRQEQGMQALRDEMAQTRGAINQNTDAVRDARSAINRLRR